MTWTLSAAHYNKAIKDSRLHPLLLQCCAATWRMIVNRLANTRLCAALEWPLWFSLISTHNVKRDVIHKTGST